MKLSFPACEAICTIRDPHDWDAAKNALMVEACREMAHFHQRKSSDIGFLYRREGFDPESLRTEADLARIPMIGVTAMKHHLLTSLPHEEAVLKLTSSGTRGQKTQIWFDADSLRRVQSQLDVQWQQEGMVSTEPTNYCAFIYDPEDAKDLGISFSVNNEKRFAPEKNSYFVVRKNAAGSWEYDKRKAYERLRAYEKEGLGTRLLGIPSFLFELIEWMRTEPEVRRDGPIRLPPNSWVITGGGWKAAEDKKVTRDQFRTMVTEALGIPHENQRDGYGMAEHSAPYIECDKHRFHVPVYNRVYARDPVTLEALPPGKPGLLEFITPFNAMMPNLAILSTDLGFVDPEDCGCGRQSPTFTLLGRGGLVKHKGCALTAGEIVRRQ